MYIHNGILMLSILVAEGISAFPPLPLVTSALALSNRQGPTSFSRPNIPLETSRLSRSMELDMAHPLIEPIRLGIHHQVDECLEFGRSLTADSVIKYKLNGLKHLPIPEAIRLEVRQFTKERVIEGLSHFCEMRAECPVPTRKYLFTEKVIEDFSIKWTKHRIDEMKSNRV
jgi:hypothetical protein